MSKQTQNIRRTKRANQKYPNLPCDCETIWKNQAPCSYVDQATTHQGLIMHALSRSTRRVATSVARKCAVPQLQTACFSSSSPTFPPSNFNPHLQSMDSDFLYHLGLSTHDDLKALFHDVKFLCMGGSSHRIDSFATKVLEELGPQSKENLIGLPSDTEVLEPVGKTERFQT